MAKVLELQFQHQPSNEYSGLISFRVDCLDLLSSQGSLENFLQHHSSKAQIIWCSAFFMVQFSHPHMTTWKTIALERQTFVNKVTSLLFNMLSRLVIAFLPRSECLLISWLQSPSAVLLESPKIVCHCFHCFPLYLHKLESRLLGEISITSDILMTPPLRHKAKRNQRASGWKWKRRVKKLA